MPMDSPGLPASVATISTQGISDRDRDGLIRDFYGRINLGVDVEG